MDDQLLLGRGGGDPEQLQALLQAVAPAQAAPAANAVPFPEQGQTDVWGNTHTGAFYDNPGAFQSPNPVPNPGSGEIDPFYPQIFNQRKNPPSGWFALQDYFAANAKPDATFNTVPVDWSFQGGSNMQNSTNDYRLFGGKPGQFMINGHLIDFNNGGAASMDAIRTQYGSHPASGAGLGVPIAFAIGGFQGPTMYGYPGDTAGWTLRDPHGLI